MNYFCSSYFYNNDIKIYRFYPKPIFKKTFIDIPESILEKMTVYKGGKDNTFVLPGRRGSDTFQLETKLFEKELQASPRWDHVKIQENDISVFYEINNNVSAKRVKRNISSFKRFLIHKYLNDYEICHISHSSVKQNGDVTFYFTANCNIPERNKFINELNKIPGIHVEDSISEITIFYKDFKNIRFISEDSFLEHKNLLIDVNNILYYKPENFNIQFKKFKKTPLNFFIDFSLYEAEIYRAFYDEKTEELFELSGYVYSDMNTAITATVSINDALRNLDILNAIAIDTDFDELYAIPYLYRQHESFMFSINIPINIEQIPVSKDDLLKYLLEEFCEKFIHHKISKSTINFFQLDNGIIQISGIINN